MPESDAIDFPNEADKGAGRPSRNSTALCARPKHV
jgi:hypothetical protein